MYNTEDINNILKEYSVSEVVNFIKSTLEQKFFFIKIKGEIINYKKHQSGHIYFSLKDSYSLINVVFFKNYIYSTNLDLKDGLDVIVTGKISIYKDRSTYQILAEKVDIYGDGYLLKIIQERKEKLSKEGYFDISFKKQITKYPNKIGLITAKDGAALQDILSRLRERTFVKIYLYSALMQGKNSTEEIITGIKYFNNLQKKLQPQVIVITRGGGSLEDLLNFSDEKLVKEVFYSQIPIISAIGHEIDWPLIDYASDLRLPTPTSVAEYLTIKKEDAKNIVFDLIQKLFKIRIDYIHKKQLELNQIFYLFLLKKSHFITHNKYILYMYQTKIENFLRLTIKRIFEIQNYIRTINLNKILKNYILTLNNNFKLTNLKLKNVIKIYPYLIDKNKKKIFFKKDIQINKEYTLKFLDGNVKIKIIN